MSHSAVVWLRPNVTQESESSAGLERVVSRFAMPALPQHVSGPGPVSCRTAGIAIRSG